MVERNIPIPQHNGVGAPLKYPWGEMQVGDSILVQTRAAAVAARQWALRHNVVRRFTVREVGEKEYRIWRVE